MRQDVLLLLELGITYKSILILSPFLVLKLIDY
jgi:hypothetical protein